MFHPFHCRAQINNERGYRFPANGESPEHAITVAAFYIDETTVTKEQFSGPEKYLNNCLSIV